MKIAFFVNDVATEKAGFTTTRLARAAADAGHDVYAIGAEDFHYTGEHIVARGRRGAAGAGSLEEFIDNRVFHNNLPVGRGFAISPDGSVFAYGYDNRLVLARTPVALMTPRAIGVR